MQRPLPTRPAFPLLLLSLGALLYSCGNHDPAPSSANTAPASGEAPEEERIGVRLNALGDSVFELGEYPAAIGFYQRSMDSAAAQADSFPYYDSQLDLACVHDRLGEIQKAIELTNPVVEAYIRSGDSTRIGRAYTTLAGFYSKAQESEKCLEASRKGFDILKQDESLIHRCAAYNQMAFVYSGQGLWSQALPLLDTALQLMEASGVLNQHPGMLLNLGDCHRNLGDWTQARRYLQTALREADSLGQAHIHARALERLSQVAEATGDPVTALHLFQEAKSIRDSIFSADKDRTIRELEVAFQTREKDQQIQLLQAEQEVEAWQSRMLFSGYTAALLLLAYILYGVRQKLVRTRRTLDQNREDLLEYTRLLQSKNARLAALELALEQQATGDRLAAVTTESLFNSRILTDEDWEVFKRRFEAGNPGFLLRLRAAYPELSGAEERLLLLLKLGLNSQEVADTLGITVNGVKKGRQRLRKRLEIGPEEDLEAFIKKLAGPK